MKKVLLGFVIIGILGGCASSVPVKINVSTAEELPKAIAINYLNKIANEYRGRTHSLNVKYVCEFDGDGVYNKKTRKRYDQANLTVDSSPRTGVFNIQLSLNDTIYDCFLADSPYQGKEPTDEQMKMFVKIATALKSLGVNVNTKK
ncbi:MAG: hypothetical protein KAU29_12540 [Gammaproteobacteria bacterium]|nr:hypothetical protein [Gammaproteobacteria bacterium]